MRFGGGREPAEVTQNLEQKEVNMEGKKREERNELKEEEEEEEEEKEN